MKRRIIVLAVGALATTSLLYACASHPASKNVSSTEAPTTDTSAPIAEVSDPVTEYTPTPEDFKVGVIVTQKHCFGSAGCNVSYRISPEYSGPPLRENQSFMVTYSLHGGSEVQEGNFTTTGSQAEFPKEELIDTERSSSKLTVVVTGVLKN